MFKGAGTALLVAVAVLSIARVVVACVVVVEQPALLAPGASVTDSKEQKCDIATRSPTTNC